MLRILRVVRLFQVAQRYEPLHRIINTFVYVTPQICSRSVMVCGLGSGGRWDSGWSTSLEYLRCCLGLGTHVFECCRVAIPAFLKIAAVFLMIFFVYAIAGMNLFGEVRYTSYLSDRGNFKNFPNSLVTLFRFVRYDEIMLVVCTSAFGYPGSKERDVDCLRFEIVHRGIHAPSE